MLAVGLATVGCDRTRAIYTKYQLTQTRTKSFQTIKTQPLSPQAIRLDLRNLPAPFITKSERKPPVVVPMPQHPVLRVPPGFRVNIYAEGLNAPRWLALTPASDVLVPQTKKNRISLLHSSKNNGVADVRQIFANAANGLNIPFGMAFSGNYFFLGNTNAVLRFTYNQGQQQLLGVGEKIADLPGGGYNQHWTRNVVVSPDQKKLYVSIGSRTDASEEELPRASVQQMNLDGSQRRTFAFGLRNPVGLDFQPITHELYTTVNERDGLGNDLVPDYLTHLRQGEFYGWPYAYLTPKNPDPRYIQDHRSITT